MLSTLKELWKALMVPNTEQDLEGRIFSSISVIAILYLLSMTVFNLFIAQWWLALLLFVTSGIIFVFHTLAKRKNNYRWAVRTLAAISYPILIGNFFLNDGTVGPSAYVFILVHIITLSLLDPKEFWFWGILNTIIFSLLYYLDFFHPEFIAENYSSLGLMLSDHIVTYLACIAGIIAIISVLKKNYQYQKQISDKKSKDFEQANSDLERSVKQKNKIIALISHDLKSPLMSITKIMEMIKEGEFSTEEIQGLQEDLYLMASNTQKMTESILEWAAIELNDTQTQLKTINIQKECKYILNVYSLLAEQKKILFTYKFSGNTTFTTEMDRLALIIRNLLQNALKFTQNGGAIHFNFQNNGEEIHIEIKDTGIGISQKKLGDLFKMDLRSHAGTSGEKGYGIGLFICQENVKKIGGQLKVSSILGEGSTFTLVVPVKRLP
ncbi:hypothetical protein GCM10028791_29000 [Echinicola sediminis]